MPIRITGMNSGLDTESIITALTSSKQTKLDNFKGDQKKLTWKQDKWKELNKKVVSFYNGTLANMRFTTAYTKKTTTSSNDKAVSVITGDSAMNTTQKLSVNSLATSAYMTGGEMSSSGDITGSTMVDQLKNFSAGPLTISIGDPEDTENLQTYTVDVEGSDSIQEVIGKLKGQVGDKINFNFDEKNGRIFASAKESGVENTFRISGGAADALGLSEAKAKYLDGSSASITLNDETYTSNSNTFEINGLTITANEIAEDITLTTKQDTSGIYDNIKKLIKEYNDLMKEFATLYNADAATKYKMLTDEQKDAMSDKEVEEWENKIKTGLLSKDETVGNLRSALRGIAGGSFEISLKDGTTSQLSLASFGIATGSYFSTEENERDVLHIDGDPDDTTSSGNTDLLKAMISSDPDAVMGFFTEFSKNMYGKLSDLMKGTQYSSSFTIYEDKLMASQYSAYNTKISDAQSALEAAQDKLYKRFSKMETALSKINSSSGSLSSFFGGGS